MKFKTINNWCCDQVPFWRIFMIKTEVLSTLGCFVDIDYFSYDVVYFHVTVLIYSLCS